MVDRINFLIFFSTYDIYYSANILYNTDLHNWVCEMNPWCPFVPKINCDMTARTILRLSLTYNWQGCAVSKIHCRREWSRGHVDNGVDAH